MVFISYIINIIQYLEITIGMYYIPYYKKVVNYKFCSD